MFENDNPIHKHEKFNFYDMICQCIKMDNQDNGVAVIRVELPNGSTYNRYLEACAMFQTTDLLFFKITVAKYLDIAVTDVTARMMVTQYDEYYLVLHCRYMLPKCAIDNYNNLWHIFPDSNYSPPPVIHETIEPFSISGIHSPDDTNTTVDGHFLLSITVNEPGDRSYRSIQPILFNATVSCLNIDEIVELIPDYHILNQTSLGKRITSKIQNIIQGLDDTYYCYGTPVVTRRENIVVPVKNFSYEHFGIYVISTMRQFLQYYLDKVCLSEMIVRPYDMSKRQGFDALELYQKYGNGVLEVAERSLLALTRNMYCIDGMVYAPSVKESSIVETKYGHSFCFKLIPSFITFDFNRVSHPDPVIMKLFNETKKPFFLYSDVESGIRFAFPVAGINPVEEAICYVRLNQNAPVMRDSVLQMFTVENILYMQAIGFENGFDYFAIYIGEAHFRFLESDQTRAEIETFMPLTSVYDSCGICEYPNLALTRLLRILADAINYEQYETLGVKTNRPVSGFYQAAKDWIDCTELHDDQYKIHDIAIAALDTFMATEYKPNEDNHLHFLDTESGKIASDEFMSEVFKKECPMPEAEVLIEGEIDMGHIKKYRPNGTIMERIRKLFQ